MTVISRVNRHYIVQSVAEIAYFKRFNLPRGTIVIKTRKHEKLAYNPRHSVALLDSHLKEILLRFLVQLRILKHGFHCAFYTRKRRAKLVRNIRNELPAGFVKLISAGVVVNNAHNTGIFLFALRVSELGKRDIKRFALENNVAYDVILAFPVLSGNIPVIYLQNTHHMRK